MPQHIIVRDPHDPKSLALQKRVAVAVVFLLFRMLASIELDNEFCFEANEIGNVRADRILPLKLVSCGSAAPDMPPKLSFGVCLLAAQSSSIAAVKRMGIPFRDLPLCDHRPLTLTLSPKKDGGEGKRSRIACAGHPKGGAITLDVTHTAAYISA